MTKLDLRDLAMIIAKTHGLTLESVVCADEVSESDEEFLTAVIASADLKGVCDEMATN
jgi:hypothetical protein